MLSINPIFFISKLASFVIVKRYKQTIRGHWNKLSAKIMQNDKKNICNFIKKNCTTNFMTILAINDLLKRRLTREFKEFQFKRNDCSWNLLRIIWRRLSWMKYQIDSNLRQQIFLNEIAMKRFSFIGLHWIAGECRYSCECFHKITLWSFLSTKN